MDLLGAGGMQSLTGKWDGSPGVTEAPYLLARVRMGVTLISGVQKVSPDSSTGKSDT